MAALVHEVSLVCRLCYPDKSLQARVCVCVCCHHGNSVAWDCCWNRCRSEGLTVWSVGGFLCGGGANGLTDCWPTFSQRFTHKCAMSAKFSRLTGLLTSCLFLPLFLKHCTSTQASLPMISWPLTQMSSAASKQTCISPANRLCGRLTDARILFSSICYSQS